MQPVAHSCVRCGSALRTGRTTWSKARLVGVISLLVGLFGIDVVAQQVKVGANVQVSRARGDQPHGETMVAADPKNPKKLVGGSMVYAREKGFNGYKVITYASSDGGRSWEPTLEVDHGWQWGAGDPAYAYGPDGSAYFVYIGQGWKPEGDSYAKLYVRRSMDGGRTWLAPTTLPVMDREYVTVDTTGGKYHGRVYVHGNGDHWTLDGSANAIGNRTLITNLTVFRSTDGGKTFDLPSTLLPRSYEQPVRFMTNGAVLSDGTFAILFPVVTSPETLPRSKPDKPNASLQLVTSEDGGEMFSKAVTVSDVYFAVRPEFGPPGTLAVDQSKGPFRDRLYTAWWDFRSGRSEILLASSSDKGKTWSSPVVVNDDRARAERGPDNFMPVVAVNADGVVGVMWYDRRDSPDNIGYWVRFAASLDGGETFLPSVRVSEAPNDPNTGTLFPYLYRAGSHPGYPPVSTLSVTVGLNFFTIGGGHTAGMAAGADGVFHPFWVDNRTGVQQIWTTSVTVEAKAIRNGSADLENLEDITSKVALDFANPRYDRTTNTVTLDAVLVNISKESLSGPFKLKVQSMKSILGSPEILNADNGGKLRGAVWDFGAPVGGSTLKPGERLKARRLEFRLNDVRSDVTLDKVDFEGVMKLEAKVYAKVQPSATR